MHAVFRLTLLAALFLTDALPWSTPAVAASAQAAPLAHKTAGERVLLFPTGPVVDPGSALEEGKEALIIGDYPTAIVRFTSILDLRGDAAETADARFYLGKTLFLAGDYARATDAFLEFRARHRDHERSDTALFWLAESYRKASRPAEADELYQSYLPRHPQVADYVGLARVRTLMDLGDFEQASSLAATVAETTLSSVLPLQARWLIADALTAQDKHQEAAQAYTALVPQAADEGSKASLLYLAADAWRLAGQTPKQVETLTSIVIQYPRSSSSLPALQTLDQLQPGRFNPYQRGRIYFYQRQNDAALRAFQQQVILNPRSQEASWAHYLSAIVYERLGRDRDAIAELQTVVQNSPDHSAAKEALWELAWLLGLLKQHNESAEAYQLYQNRYPGTPQTDVALFKEGLARYQAGNFGEAARLWSISAPGPAAGVNRGQTEYWLQKAQMALGDQARAQKIGRENVERHEGRYYAFRASDIQDGHAQPPPPDGRDASLESTISAAEIDAARSWLAQWSAAAAIADWGDLRHLVANDEHVLRGMLLQELGLWSGANEEFRVAVQSNKIDMPFLLELARFLYDQGEYGAAVSAVGAISLAIPTSFQKTTPSLLNKILYPVPFFEETVAQAHAYGLDPFLLFALMRQESLFNPRAVSSAGAIGLTQILPNTGAEIAQDMAFKGFRPEDLYRPTVNIQFGAYYLARQRQTLANHPVYALAGYNAGSLSAAIWMNAGGPDPDVFLEMIGFDETSTYVKVIMENYHRYREIYAG